MLFHSEAWLRPLSPITGYLLTMEITMSLNKMLRGDNTITFRCTVWVSGQPEIKNHLDEWQSNNLLLCNLFVVGVRTAGYTEFFRKNKRIQ